MDLKHWLLFALACSLVCAMTVLGCRWWYVRKLDAMSHRLQKSEKARLFSVQQTLQARRQIEALQKDLAAQHEAMAQARMAKQRSRHLEEVLKSAAEEESQAIEKPPAQGFADTQPMTEAKSARDR